jgi:predicted phosphodiesterase/tetratricopeptide (TPR) repeat protein
MSASARDSAIELARSGHIGEAIVILDGWIASHPISPTEEYADALLLRAECHQKNGDLDEARSDLELAHSLGLPPGRVQKYYILIAKLASQAGQISESRDALDHFQLVDDTLSSTYLWRASFAALVLGDKTAGRRLADAHSERVEQNGFQAANHEIFLELLPQLLHDDADRPSLFKSLDAVRWAGDVYLTSSIDFAGRVGHRGKTFCQALIAEAMLQWSVQNRYYAYYLTCSSALLLRAWRLNQTAEGIGEMIHLESSIAPELYGLLVSILAHDSNSPFATVADDPLVLAALGEAVESCAEAIRSGDYGRVYAQDERRKTLSGTGPLTLPEADSSLRTTSSIAQPDQFDPGAGYFLLHLSDVHFRSQRLGPEWDFDAGLRHESRRQILSLVDSLGIAIEAIVVGGDIAFSAAQAEYDSAGEWLASLVSDLSARSGLLLVPGNHDVDWTEADTRQTVKELARSVRDASDSEVEQRVSALLHDAESRSALLSGLSRYVAFAKELASPVLSDTILHWEHSLRDQGKPRIVIRGLCSVVYSDITDNDSNRRLLITPEQLNFVRTQDSLVITVCHHPMDWLRRGDRVRDAIRPFVSLALWGHKHRSRLEQLDGCIHVAAGALQPSRNEEKWEPSFNLIWIGTDGPAKTRTVVWQRVWSEEDATFIPRFSKDGKEYREWILDSLV